MPSGALRLVSMPDFEYATLTENDKLLLVRDTLRGRESDHYRLSLLAQSEGAYIPRVAALEEEISVLREEVAAQEQRAAVETAEIEPPRDPGNY